MCGRCDRGVDLLLVSLPLLQRECPVLHPSQKPLGVTVPFSAFHTSASVLPWGWLYTRQMSTSAGIEEESHTDDQDGI